MAAYGLTALIAGGVGAAAAKSGLLAKLWKAIVVGIMALVAAIRKMFAKAFGKPSPGVQQRLPLLIEARVESESKPRGYISRSGRRIVGGPVGDEA